jgi:hypothetical protein
MRAVSLWKHRLKTQRLDRYMAAKSGRLSRKIQAGNTPQRVHRELAELEGLLGVLVATSRGGAPEKVGIKMRACVEGQSTLDCEEQVQKLIRQLDRQVTKPPRSTMPVPSFVSKVCHGRGGQNE